MTTTARAPSVNMRTAVALLEIFIVAITLALVATVTSVSSTVALLALSAVTPMIVLGLIFVYYCRKGKAWSFAGAAILGLAGVALRVIISAQPALEVGGGLPIGVTVIYIVMGALVSLKTYESFLELRTS